MFTGTFRCAPLSEGKRRPPDPVVSGAGVQSLAKALREHAGQTIRAEGRVKLKPELTADWRT